MVALCPLQSVSEPATRKTRWTDAELMARVEQLQTDLRRGFAILLVALGPASSWSISFFSGEPPRRRRDRRLPSPGPITEPFPRFRQGMDPPRALRTVLVRTCAHGPETSR
ncbi:hypothetical protein GCM10017788_62050 [Amycolatopsis acidiphila]|nr:hypothetical protein GCM10017788_62050 [Amycolatopsis acidiphila]